MPVINSTGSRWLMMVAALALLASACASSEQLEQAEGEGGVGGSAGGGEAGEAAEQPSGEPVQGGTVTFGGDQEPEILNPLLPEGSLTATAAVAVSTLRRLYAITPDFEYVPDLLEGEAEVTEDPFSVTYTLQEGLQWNDGEPLTAEDVAFSYEVKVNPDNNITSRDGYDRVSGYEILDERTIRFDFDEPYAPWRSLFATADGAILPQHVLEGQDFNQAMLEGYEFASGPFQFESWDRGQQLTLVRNENYSGEPAALDSIVFRYIEDSNTQVQALRAGEIDMFYPQPQVDLLEQVDAIDDVTSQTKLGPQWEHLDFQFGNPALSQQYVRQAIAYAIDREAITQQLIAPLNAEAQPLHNAIWMINQEPYEPHFDRYAYDPDRARELLEDNGCAQGADGIYECNGERLSFTYKTTAGNALRELQQQVIQQQLAEVGIEVTPQNGEAAVILGTDLTSCNFEIINFAWVGSPDPASGNTIFTIDGVACEDGVGQNYTGYESQEVTDLVNETNVTVDEEERAALYNQVDEILAEDVPLLPLYQKPTFFAWRNTIQGPEDNPTQEGPFWNVAEWTLTE